MSSFLESEREEKPPGQIFPFVRIQPWHRNREKEREGAAWRVDCVWREQESDVLNA